MFHPTCGSDLRRSTKAVAMTNSIVSGMSIFAGIAVLNNVLGSVKDAQASALPVGSLILFILLMGAEIYLAFRLYRAAHERDIQRLRIWWKSSGVVMGLCTLTMIILCHTVSSIGSIPSSLSPFPMLWFYVIYLLSAIFRGYMIWVVWSFMAEFALP